MFWGYSKWPWTFKSAPRWNGTSRSSCAFGNIVLLKVVLQGWIYCLSGCLFTFFKSDESSFVGFGCVIFIRFQVLSLFLLACLFVLKILFVLGIEVGEHCAISMGHEGTRNFYFSDELCGCHHPLTLDWQLPWGRLASQGHLNLHTYRRWCGLTMLSQASFRCCWDLFPACVSFTAKTAQDVLCSCTTLCTSRFVCGISRATALTTQLNDPKICTTSTSHTALRKISTVQNFLNTSVLKNTYVTRSKVYLKNRFRCEWVGIMKISPQVMQIFALSLLGAMKAALDFQSCWAVMGESAGEPHLSVFWLLNKC